jgi:ATP-binding cassette, subfamily B, bacterial MsbA
MKRFLPYLRYLRQVRTPLIIAIICGLIYGAASGYGLPYMLKKVFPVIFGKDAPELSKWGIIGYSLYLPMIFIIRGLAGYFNAYFTQFVGVRVLESLRLDYFTKLQQLPLAFFHRNSSGDLITRGLNDTNQLQSIISIIANDLIKQPATLIGALGFLIYLGMTAKGAPLVLLSIAIIPITVLPIHFVGKKIIQKARQMASQSGSITDRFAENLSAVKEVRAFGLEQMESRRFALASSFMVKTQMKVAKYALMLSPSIELISAIGVSVTFVYAYKAHIQLETFLSIIAALLASYDPVKKLGAISNELQRGTASLDRIEEVINAPSEIEDPINPTPIGKLSGTIEYRDVSFAYKDDNKALNQVSVSIPAGTICALVGPSGAGKSTFANLVPRFYDASMGSVIIDGVDVRAMRVADLRRNIAIVSQDPVLFNDTIYNNLLFGRLDASRDDVEQAARDAFAHDFILSLPQGYGTIVGERGGKLSGGQRQRVALARAFLRQAPILILDEATSALDSESEAFIQQALKKLMQNKTVLIIAHRFSTIRDANMILVFSGAQIVAHGTHAELYATNQLYKSLYDQQQRLPQH